MFSRLLPADGSFFEHFDKLATQVVEGNKVLVELLHRFDDLAARRQLIAKVDDIEKSADKTTLDTIAMAHKTFITPIDRDQIHTLVNALDDVLDLVQDVAEAVVLYDLQSVTKEAVQLAELGLMGAERLRDAVKLMANWDNARAILQTCEEIDRLESDADRVMRAAMSKLFRDEEDTKQVIKMKAVYELLEELTDKCKDAAKIVEVVVLDHA
ncbi:MAG: DUF47 domain-containing protein [Betaproteobacteria bacterium]|jgi:uncharacterized protein Yka (UPF0111/DUF47 family)|nr:DUF47 domain-containing protein [Betaproteobacteria bacterium]NBO94529.1 DUF47 domain-containing protein [Betaproteobacteria bacterium]NBP34674.1 DUF47 domain-containing protein [Betaproteobacteria bacterium]NBP37416.1 DUF47 domain-containing protein [Betaproteobacteria bacterium]NBQ78513.1 DUF47 domain-containing protein [Betaproteobacteria bacterium]